MRIGVISDTHISDLMEKLPPRMEEVFSGLDIILHAGDVCKLEVLRKLQNEYTITMAVYGDDDSAEIKQYIDEKRVIGFSRRRIGLIHGHQFRPLTFMPRIRMLLKGQDVKYAFNEYILSQFENVDCIVFGHTHRPYVRVYKGVLFFNPGSAAPNPGMRPSVGILDITDRAITGEIVYL